MDDRTLYVTNPSKVPERYKKYLYPVVFGEEFTLIIKKIVYPPKMVIYHSYLPTFNKIVNELRRLGVHFYRPQYGYMFGGKFHAIPGVTMW